jgi:hypothetical protein
VCSHLLLPVPGAATFDTAVVVMRQTVGDWTDRERARSAEDRVSGSGAMEA